MCSVCVNDLHDPRMLPCGHTFCMECITQFKSLLCPHCREPFQSAETLPKNFALLERLEGVCVCVTCEKRSAVLWCETCSAISSGYLCQECDISEHSNRLGKFHQRITLKEKAKKAVTTKMYCIDCTMVILDTRLIEYHSGHDIWTVEKHTEKERERLKRSLSMLSANAFPEMRDVILAKRRKLDVEIESINESERQYITQCERMVREINEMNVFELAEIQCVNDFEARIGELRALSDGVKMNEKRKKEKKQVSQIKLIESTYFGPTNSEQKEYTLSSDGRTFIKHNPSTCCISFPSSITHWRVRYLGCTYQKDKTIGRLSLGVHSDLSKSDIPHDDKETQFYGVRVAPKGGVWSGGVFKKNPNLSVELGDIICVNLEGNQITVRMANDKWTQTIELPIMRTWYPHFIPYSASFSLL